MRPNRYFPVEVRTDAAITLLADGCVPTDVAAGTTGVVPVLAIDPAGTIGGTRLRVPADGERLVGTTTGTVPAELFPGGRTVPVRLDPAAPLPGPPAAWEVLDAVVLDPAAMAAVNDAHRSALLSGGVTLATTGPDAPDDRWPWARRGSLWVLAYTPAGPGDLVGADVYGPTDQWTPGAPPAVRRTAVAVAVGLAIVTVALLVRHRSRPSIPPADEHPGQSPGLMITVPMHHWRAVAAVLVPLVTAAGVLAWRATLDPVAHAGGDVTVATPRLVQRDRWAYDRARSATTATVPWAGWTHPAFASPAAAAAARLTVSADGRLAFRLPLAAVAAAAFVRRDVTPAGNPVPTTATHGAAMRTVASAVYLSFGDRIVGETAPPPGRWPGVLIARPGTP